MLTLTSARNPVLKEVRKAVLRGSRTENGLCVAESFHLLEEALRSGCQIERVFTTEAARPAVESCLRGLNSVRLIALEESLLQTISSTEHTQGVIALVRPPDWSLEQLFCGQALVVVLDRVQDPGNAGTILRTAEAFGATGVAFLKGSVDPFNPKAIRASAGSVFRLPLVSVLDERLALEAIDQSNVELFAMLPGKALAVEDCRLDRSCALVIGNESQGISEQMRARATHVRIPTTGVESLNAAIAAAIALYEARRQRNRSLP